MIKNFLIFSIPVLLILTAYAHAAEIKQLEDFKAVTWKGKQAATLSEYKYAGKKKRPAIRFKPNRKAMLWSKELQNDLSKMQAIAIRLYSFGQAQGSITLGSEKGHIFKPFSITSGEQIAILPFKTFKEENSFKLSENKEITLSFNSREKNSKILFLELYTISDDTAAVTDSNLYLITPYSRLNRQTSMWPIYEIISKQLDKSLRVPLRDLKRHISTIYGTTLPHHQLHDVDKGVLSNAFLLGRDTTLKAGTISSSEILPQGYQGFIIKAANGSISIAGSSRHSVAYGIYSFLEKQGCRFFGRGFDQIPKNKVKIINSYTRKDKPVYDIKGPSADYSIKGWNYSMMGDPRIAAKEHGEEKLFDKSLWVDHTSAYLVPAKIYYDKHPEYYAKFGDGKRMPKETPANRVMLCLTHPDVLKISVRRMLRWIAAQPDRMSFVAAQGDAPENCQCKRCLAAGNAADQMLVWTNYIAKAVARKYSDRYIVTHAYNGSDIPPLNKNIQLSKNLIILYAPWPNKTNAPNLLRDFEAPENFLAKSWLKGWLETAPGRIGLYDYNNNEKLSLLGMANRVKWGARHNMRGIWYCGSNSIFKGLFTYVHSQLCWDPMQDTRSLIRDYIRASYGETAPVVQELFDHIYDRIETKQFDKNTRAGGYLPPEYYSSKFVSRLYSLIGCGIAMAENIKDQRTVRRLADIRNKFSKVIIHTIGPKREGTLTEDSNAVFKIALQSYVNESWLPEYKNLLEVSKGGTPLYQDWRRLAAKKKVDWQKESRKLKTKLTEMVKRATFVDTGITSEDGTLSTLLQQMLNNPLQVINKHRKTDFTKKTADGIKLPAIHFSGSRFFAKYPWFCEPRDGTAIYGSMTEYNQSVAKFNFTANPDKNAELIIDGQDCDKFWCPTAPLLITLNGRQIFKGDSGFKKRGWSKQIYVIHAGTLKKGENTLAIKNLFSTDSLVSHWFMLNEAQIVLRDK
jgi:hypothetical protein